MGINFSLTCQSAGIKADYLTGKSRGVRLTIISWPADAAACQPSGNRQPPDSSLKNIVKKRGLIEKKTGQNI